MIPQDTVQKVIDTADIVEVVSDFVSLQRAGTNYKGQCPFHNERTPSFIVSPAKQIFKCFGCGEAGTPISFLMKHEHLTFPEAIRWLAKKYNIEIEEKELSAEEIATMQERESVLILNAFAQKHFSENLSDTEEGQTIAYSYFKNRGFTDETILKFQLGYSLDSRSSLLYSAVNKGHKAEMIEKAGLVIEKQPDAITKIISGKQKYYDRFRGRVMFPIHSLSGNVIAFGGRILRADKNMAKYLNSPETIVYHKRNSLYGIFFAKNEIVKQDKCYLVEGYTDVISFHQAGITNVVASSGTSLTEDQIRIIRRFTRNLTLIFDGDSAGQNAAIRGVDMVLQEDMNVRVIPLPEGEDPDTFSRKMPLSELKEFIETNEKDFIIFKTQLLSTDQQSDPIKKSEAVKDIVKSISVIPDQFKRDAYIKETSTLLNIKEEMIFDEINKILKKEQRNQNKTQYQTTPTEKKTPKIPDFIDETALPEEKQLIYFLLKFGSRVLDKVDEPENKETVAEFIINEMESENGFRNVVYQEIFEFYKSEFDEKRDVNSALFLNHQIDKIRDTSIDILSNEHTLSKIWTKNGNVIETPEDSFSKDVEKTIIAFKLRIIELYIKKNAEQLNDPNIEEASIETLMRQSIEAQKIRKHLMDIGGKRNIYG
ncbi:MAG: DNA primase [Bacteroidales bacterium]|nr:DNA primase [Bacteroidales bacterium]